MTDVDNRPTDQKELEHWYKDQAAVLSDKEPEDRNPGEERDMTVEGNDTSGYSSDVDPMYRNYASDTEKPGEAEEGVNYVAEQVAAAGGLSTNEGAVVTEGEGDSGEVQVEETEPESPHDPPADPPVDPPADPPVDPPADPPAPDPSGVPSTEGVAGKTKK